jgi:hypothetical protein
VKITIEVPQVGRKRLVGAAVLCATATVLWIAAPAYLPFAVVSWQLVVVGVAIPFGVGYVTLLLMERRILRDLTPAQRGARERAEAVVSR